MYFGLDDIKNNTFFVVPVEELEKVQKEIEEKCKSCSYSYPSIECINCGSKYFNYKNKDKKITNYEKLKNMTIEEMAKNRISIDQYHSWDRVKYYGDFVGFEYDSENAVKKEIDWLSKEVI